MHLYDARIDHFIPHASSGQIADLLSKRFQMQMEAHATESEIRSWHNSLGAFADAIDGVGMDESWIVVEYQLPLSSSRVDCMILGTDSNSDQHAALVEFKQWDGCEAYYVPDVVRVGGLEQLHPSAQVRAYRQYLKDAHSAFVDGGVSLSSCAYLHNVRDGDLSDFHAMQYHSLIQDSPAFTVDQVSDLARFLGEQTRFGADDGFVNAVLHGQYQPSKTLLTNVADSIEGYEPWQLLDNQLLVFNRIMADIESARTNGEKRTIIVTGGPGSGKSIIAVQTVGTAARNGYSVAHATGSKAFTTNMKGIVGQKADAVFRYTHQFRDALPDSVDLIVTDEAHRLRRQTQFGPSIYSKRPQAEEIVDAAKVSVFLLDQQQGVRMNEVGSVWGIQDYAESQGIPVHIYDLDLQFRCAGSESYIKWVEHALALKPQQSMAWRRNNEYEVRVFDDVADMENAIRDQAAEGNSARLVAGFCWEWSDPRHDDTLVNDVTIGGWSMPWNRKPREMLKKGKKTPAKPEDHPYTIWATQPHGINEVGCIYSAQGFEFDYVGVIFGRDLRWDVRRGRWIPDLAHNVDRSFKNGITKDPELAHQQLAHVYRVLSTRGMKGTYFYFLDDETRHHFEKLLRQ